MAHGRHDAELRTQERAADFGHEFFEGVSL
jgi:hypothetical protein